MRPLLLAAVVLLLIAVGTHNCDDSADETCAQSSACRCLTGHGAGIDLQPLSSVKFLATPLINSLTYYFHPCHDVDMQVVDAGNKTWTCESSSLCMFNHTGNNTFTSLGKTANSEFHDSPTHDRFIVVKLPGPEPKTTLIQLGCTNVEADRLFGLPSESEDIHLVLYSRHACMRPLVEDHSFSTGAILLISFFTLVFAYFVIGMTVNYFLVGARGIEMLPHLSFWRDFPSLVRDGVAFLQNGCTPVTRDDLLTPNTPNPNSYVSI